MINLLPPEVKNGYNYARRNVVLVKWVVAFVIAFAGLGAVATYGVLSIRQSTDAAQQRVTTSEAFLKKEKLWRYSSRFRRSFSRSP